MKETYYFSHDYNARNDLKITRLRHKYGMEGLGVYWCLVEMLYEEGGYLMLSDSECIANELRTQCDTLKSIITSDDLFKNDGEKFWSNSVLRRLEKRHEKSQKASESATKRWDNANAMRTQCDGNASKGKERKGNKIKEEEITANITTAAGDISKKTSEKVETFKTWEECTGRLITEHEGRQLDDFISEHGDIQVCMAIKESANNGRHKLNIKYLNAILERWRVEGRPSGNSSQPAPEGKGKGTGNYCPAPSWLLEGLNANTEIQG